MPDHPTMTKEEADAFIASVLSGEAITQMREDSLRAQEALRNMQHAIQSLLTTLEENRQSIPSETPESESVLLAELIP